jgi:hypothetical protein
VVRCAALLLLSCAALAPTGCGRSESSSSAELRLEREDLLAVAHALQHTQGPVEREVAAAKAAWPLVAHGLPADTAAIQRAPILAATAAAAKLPMPGPLQEAQARMLTGPGSSIAGLFRTYAGLAAHGWQIIDTSIDVIEHGSPAAARFARANVALYIESVYDAHFTVAQIGKKVLDGYSKLGAGTAFGVALTADELEALAHAYSEVTDRLHPHVAVRLGS